MPRQSKHWLAMTVLLVAGCGHPSSHDYVKAPFTAEIADFTVTVPQTAAYKNPSFIYADRAFKIASFDLCPRSSVDGSLPKGCSAFAYLPMTDGGIRVSLSSLRIPTDSLLYFRAQPAGPPPSGLPLIALGNKPGPVHIPGATDVEAALVGRLQPPKPGFVATTAQRWPTVGCVRPPPGRECLTCAAGFLMGAMYVEAHWTEEPDVDLTQAYVWGVAKKIPDSISPLIR